MVKRNPHLEKLKSGYLFPEITRRKKAYLEKNPAAKLISLGIGDTTQPIAPFISEFLQKYSAGLSTLEGYSGYGDEQGQAALRNKLSEVIYQQKISAEEIFISDGSKCDIGRLQLMFGASVTIAVQDPTYPVYVDSGVILGQSKGIGNSLTHYPGITYMRCTPENDFFPNLTETPRTDLIYFCSPNNPTGATATREQLEKLVKKAQQERSIIVFDAAYSAYIQDRDLPKSIYEIKGADQVAIELGSFSKMAGFTGVRLGWSVVPKTVCFDDGTPVWRDWHRINTTVFNGASSIAQQGGLAVLQPEGMDAVNRMVEYYMKNASLIREALKVNGNIVYGGDNCPYLWVHFPGNNSWDLFEEFMEKRQLITTPGSGFGPAGEGFLRFSPFGSRESVLEACNRLGAYVTILK